MTKKTTKRPAKASSRQSTLNFPNTSQIDLEAEANFDKSTSTIQAPTAQPLKDSSSPRVNLPKGWQQQTLGMACDIFAGFGFPERFQGKSAGDLPFYKVGDISETWKRGDVLLTRPNNYVTHDECRELRAKPLPAGTTVFAKIGAAIALNRRAMLTESSLVDNNVMGLHPKSQNLNQRFLFHFACTLKLNELSRATTVPSIRKSDVEAIDIPIPPLPEQRRIVAEIEKQFTRLDAGVAALKRVQANLKRYRAAVLKAACEGKLVPTEAELRKDEGRRMNDETKRAKPGGSTSSFIPHPSSFESGEALLARILTERRQYWQGRGQYKEPAAPDTATLGSLPDRWAWATVEQLTSLVATGATPYRGKPAYWEGGTIPWVTSGALNDIAVRSAKEFITQLAIEETNAKVFRPGTLLVALYGEGKTRGMVSELCIEAATNQACAALLFSEFNSELRAFLRVFLLKNYNDVRLLSSGGVQPNLSLSIVKQTKIPLPPLAEQTRIVAEVERRLSVVEELETVVSANLQRATRLRQSILQKAFTGEF